MLDFGGMSDDDFFLGYDAMIDEDDPNSINYDSREHKGNYSGIMVEEAVAVLHCFQFCLFWLQY